MLYDTLAVLAEVSFAVGLIDFSEFNERMKVARWLADDDPFTVDPREPDRNEDDEPVTARSDSHWEGEPIQVASAQEGIASGQLELVVLGRWLFTRSDPDPYPSTPHGHLHNANRPWPKLNPYTGRAFKAMHQEDSRLRLRRKEMRELWQSEAFCDFGRSYILWYMEAYPH